MIEDDRKELFEGKTAEDIYREVYEFTVEERKVALDMFNKLNNFIKDPEDGFMQGDKPSPYLDSAHKSTENLIKLLQVINKATGNVDQNEKGIDISSIINLLDEKEIAPDRMRRRKEERENQKETTQDIFSKTLNIKEKREEYD